MVLEHGCQADHLSRFELSPRRQHRLHQQALELAFIVIDMCNPLSPDISLLTQLVKPSQKKLG